MSTMEEALEFAVQAVNCGDFGRGKAALSWILKQDPNHAMAWIWMACCVNDDAAKAECYRRASMLSN